MKVLVVNGPNLNMLGTREVSVYGATKLEDIVNMIRLRAAELGVEAAFFQSNSEGALIDRIHTAWREGVEGIIINPGGYTHTSVALRDALLAVSIPFIEVHISNVAQREPFRQTSYFSDIALGTISGLGPHGYVLALEGLLRCRQG
jgi:3-dehydroquinate dehydratase II